VQLSAPLIYGSSVCFKILTVAVRLAQAATQALRTQCSRASLSPLTTPSWTLAFTKADCQAKRTQSISHRRCDLVHQTALRRIDSTLSHPHQTWHAGKGKNML
jgi:hypothetical protein